VSAWVPDIATNVSGWGWLGLLFRDFFARKAYGISAYNFAPSTNG
jgi:hypothetical protein